MPSPDVDELHTVAVIIPARNEEASLPGCLSALHGAVLALRRRDPAISVRILVVLDTCWDASAEVALSLGAETLEVSAGNVGAARAAGADAVLRSYSGDADTVWLASTDADSCVPLNWLTEQVDAARAGVDVLIGTVEPDATLTGPVRTAWRQRHDLAEGHAHIHGANLGVRASSYLAVGGYRAASAHEDVDLVRRLRHAQGVRVLATDRHRVVTSSRLVARAPGGFAAYLREVVSHTHHAIGSVTAPAGSQ